MADPCGLGIGASPDMKARLMAQAWLMQQAQAANPQQQPNARTAQSPELASDLRDLIAQEPMLQRSVGIEHKGEQQLGVSGPPTPDAIHALMQLIGQDPTGMGIAPGPMQGPPVPPSYAQFIGPRPDMVGMTPYSNRMPVEGPPAADTGQFSPARQAEMMAEMNGGTPSLPSHAAPPAHRQAAARPAPSASDDLNRKMLALILARRAAQQQASR